MTSLRHWSFCECFFYSNNFPLRKWQGTSPLKDIISLTISDKSVDALSLRNSSAFCLSCSVGYTDSRGLSCPNEKRNIIIRIGSMTFVPRSEFLHGIRSLELKHGNISNAHVLSLSRSIGQNCFA